MSDAYSFGDSEDDIGPQTPLKNFRRYQVYDEIRTKPEVYRKLLALTQAEVGNQGPEAQQAFIETVLNRAASRGQTLEETMQTVDKGGYYPGAGNINKVSPQTAGSYTDLLQQVMSGSNVGNYATGNASGTVGFNKGPQVAEYGGERFGIEGPDVKTMQGIAGGEIDPQAMGFTERATPSGRKQMANGDEGILSLLGMKQQSPQGGLLGALGDPETMAYLAMALKGASPYSSLDPGSMLSNAHTTALRKQALQQQLAEQARDNARADQALKLNESKFAESKVTDAVRAAKDLGLEPGTQEYKDYLTEFYKKKTAIQHSLTPIRGEGGKIGTLDAAGNFKVIDTGDFKPEGPTTTRDLGTTIGVFDRGGNLISQTPKDIAGAAEQKEVGTQTGKAKVGLAEGLRTADQTIKEIDELIQHPGRETGTGLSSKLDPRNYIPGTDAYNFAVRGKQLEGRAFLQAYETLKGTGQITEIEGEKATQAIARMNRAQSDTEYVQALNDFKEIVNNVRGNLKKKAGISDEGASAPSASKRLRYDPQTGKMVEQ